MDGYTNKYEGFLKHIDDTSHPGPCPRGILYCYGYQAFCFKMLLVNILYTVSIQYRQAINTFTTPLENFCHDFICEDFDGIAQALNTGYIMITTRSANP
jgi:hypothetical protein